MAKQAPTPATNAGRSWTDIQAEAAERPDIYPRLEFGTGKADEGNVTVEFLEDEPRLITFKDKYNGDADTPGLAINLRVVASSFGTAAPGDYRSLIMRDDAKHGLTAGIAKLAARNGGKLNGVSARIETRNYDHKRFGETRGYTVVPVGSDGTEAP